MYNNRTSRFFYNFSAILVLFGYFLFSLNLSFSNTIRVKFEKNHSVVFYNESGQKATISSYRTNGGIGDTFFCDLFTEIELEDDNDVEDSSFYIYSNSVFANLLKVSFLNYQNTINNMPVTPLFILYCNWKSYVS